MKLVFCCFFLLVLQLVSVTSISVVADHEFLAQPGELCFSKGESCDRYPCCSPFTCAGGVCAGDDTSDDELFAEPSLLCNSIGGRCDVTLPCCGPAVCA